MNALKPTNKSSSKQNRERKVLLGLVDYYIQTGRPVGSNTLKETGFEDLSSATIRNYFAQLEEAGYLSQPHPSGGRIPTDLAYRTYAKAYLHEENIVEEKEEILSRLQNFNSKEIATFLQESAEVLSQLTNCAVFLSAPRFDQDFVADLKLVVLDSQRCLCVLITDFGVVHTEILHLPNRLSSFAIKRIEAYFQWRLTGLNKPENIEPEEEKLGQNFYNEIMVRYIVGYSHFIHEEIYRTGFSRLLTYPDYQNASVLATSLALFENAHSMRLLLRECMALNYLKFWIGDDLSNYLANSPNCSVLAIPYYINQKAVGAIGLLGPTRLPYRSLFSLLRRFSEMISEVLTKQVYKFKISFRQPSREQMSLQKEERYLTGQSSLILLEDKRHP